MRLTHMTPVFVETFPDQLEEGKLYVSMEYGNVSHLCACGCGTEVVTPLGKKGYWKLTFDGESITLLPSIGNHGFPCESHYFIRENEVKWAGRLSSEEIRAGRIANRQGGVLLEEEKHDKAEQAVPQAKVEQKEAQASSVPEPEKTLPRRAWWERFAFWRRS